MCVRSTSKFLLSFFCSTANSSQTEYKRGGYLLKYSAVAEEIGKLRPGRCCVTQATGCAAAGGQHVDEYTAVLTRYRDAE